MKQVLVERHATDMNGNPAGGTTSGTGMTIVWQNGPLGRGFEPNGAFVEGVIQAAIGRMQHYQSSKLSCRENAIALTKLEEALMWLQKRTRDREEREVEGTYTP